jgi:hypothetical protein
MDEHPGSAWQRTELGSSRLTRFEVRRSFLDNYDVHQVGGQTIPGYWIPAEDPSSTQCQHRRGDRASG